MAVTLYKWTDASAPVLTGQAGSLTTALTAILVNGYGAKPAAGWTIPSLSGTNPGTNVVAYQQGSGSNSFYIRVNNSGTRVGTTHEAVGTPATNVARIRGYETMTSLTDAGTNLSPTVAQAASGLFYRTSSTTDSTVRPWIAVADQRTFYFFVITGDTAGAYLGMGFGEFYSYKTSDPGRAMIIGRDSETTTAASVEHIDKANTVGTIQAGMFIARDASGTPGAITAGKMANFGFMNIANNIAGTASATNNTNPGDNKTYVFPFRLNHTSGGNTIRGRMRGLWCYGHAVATVSDMDTITGQNEYAGKTFLILKSSQNGSVHCIETSNTWDSN